MDAKKSYAKSDFLYQSLNLDKQDSNLTKSFIEVQAYDGYQKLRSQDIFVYPDSVNDKLSKW